jgi:hypothetical protein
MTTAQRAAKKKLLVANLRKTPAAAAAELI